MKIVFEKEQISTLDSIRSRALAEHHSYTGYIVGSQVMLRARLEYHTQEKDKIREILKRKDLDVRFEPKDSDSTKLDDLRAITEAINKNLSKKNENRLTDTWQSYYTLPNTEIKNAQITKLDPSIQYCKIKPCMNIDIKSDFTGQIQYASDQHQHDFEELYLARNLIKFYGLDTLDFSKYDDMNRLSYMLSKCLQPEVAEFKTALEPKTALYLENLIKNPVSKHIKASILAQIEIHYHFKSEAAEQLLTELYQRSNELEIFRIKRETDVQYQIITNMMAVIKKQDYDTDQFHQSLTQMMSMCSRPTVAQLESQYASIKDLRSKVEVEYILSEKKSIRKITAPPPIHVCPEPDKPMIIEREKSTKKKKIKDQSKISDPLNDISATELDTILSAEKKNYNESRVSEPGYHREYQSLIVKHSAAINNFVVPSNVRELQNKDSRESIIHFLLMAFIVEGAIQHESHEKLWIDINQLYNSTIIALISDFKSKHGGEGCSKDQDTFIFNSLKNMRLSIKNNSRFLDAIHYFMVSLYLNPDSDLDPVIFKKGMNLIRNFRESKGATIDALLKSMFDYLIPRSTDHIGACISVLSVCVLYDMCDLLRSNHTKNKLQHIRKVLELTNRIIMFQRFDQRGDIIEPGFLKILSNVLINQSIAGGDIRCMFRQKFILGAMQIFVFNKSRDVSGNFKSLVSNSGIYIVSHLFSSPHFSKNPNVVSVVIDRFSGEMGGFASHYLLINLTMLQIRPHGDLLLAMNHEEFVQVSELSNGEKNEKNSFFSSISEAATLLIVDIDMMMQKSLIPLTDIDRLCLELLKMSITKLCHSQHLLLKPNYLLEFTDLLKADKEFMDMFARLSESVKGKPVESLCTSAYPLPSQTPNPKPSENLNTVSKMALNMCTF